MTPTLNFKKAQKQQNTQSISVTFHCKSIQQVGIRKKYEFGLKILLKKLL